MDKEMQSADEYASKYKRISLYEQKRVSAATKVEEDSNSILRFNKRKFELPTLEFKKFGGDVKDWLTFGDSLRTSMKIRRLMMLTVSILVASYHTQNQSAGGVGKFSPYRQQLQ